MHSTVGPPRPTQRQLLYQQLLKGTPADASLGALPKNKAREQANRVAATSEAGCRAQVTGALERQAGTRYELR
jgi:hypothetical protein